jgi:tetratricopeptide (TPR) repeat protein
VVAVALSAMSLSGASGLATPMMQAPAQIGPEPVTAAIDQAFHAAYSLDYAEATALARKAVALCPSEARTHRTLASVLWLDVLFQRGAVTVDTFLGGMTKAQANLPKPPPELDAEFKKELGLSISLAEARLKANSRDLDARYDAGAAYALQAAYSASVEGSLMSAFGSARRAYNDHEEVLEKNPQRADAGVVVGTYRYVVSVMSLPARMFAYLAGFGGGKERGIGLLETASRDQAAHRDAAIALILIYSREGRHLDALRLLRQLEVEYPRNRLFVLEEGSAAIRAGLATDADAALTRGLAGLDRDARPRIPGERAFWLYKRGVARLAMNHLADALVDLRSALNSDQHPIDWVRGRTHLELGKIADLSADRPGALAEYRQAQTICGASSDAPCAADAGRFLKRPFNAGGRTP